MTWWRRNRRDEAPSAPAPGGPARTPLFRDSEESPRPVALGGELELAGDPSEERTEALRAIAATTKSAADRAFLARLEAHLAGSELVLPPMPETMIRIQRQLDSPTEGDVRSLGEAMQRDPALATKIVGIANSPFYAGMSPVESVEDAIVRIGLGEVRNIAFALSLRSKVFRAPGFETRIADLWEHSLATSLAAREIGAIAGIDPEAAFLLGLVHDLGRVVVFTAATAVLRRQAAQHIAVIERVEAMLHAGLGAQVARSWNLSDDHALAIRFHHDVERAPERLRARVRALAAADVFAKWLIAGRDDALAAAAAAAVEPLGLDEESCSELAAELREELASWAKT